MQILVADDEPDARLTMKALLELNGHRVELASNGRDAVELAVQRRPDVVLMDLNMPVMNGISAIRCLREQPETRDLPVICVSAYLSQGDMRDQAFQAGCNYCLPKPFDLAEFNALLERLSH